MLFSKSHIVPLSKPNFQKMDVVIDHHTRALVKMIHNNIHSEELVVRAGEQVIDVAVCPL